MILRILVLSATTTLMCGLNLSSALAADGFKRLSGAEIKRVFVGRAVGDNAHWSYSLTADGGVQSMGLGKRKPGVWHLSRGELCLEFNERGRPVSDCYEIWPSGKNVRFVRDGVLIDEGTLLDE
jgi:hypothetical protein